MIINHNISALNTHRQLNANNNAVSESLEKLSSGLKINRAGDDAAGLAISEKMRGQIRGLEMASKNAQDGISLIQTAEGALNETHSILQRMRELAVQSSNDTNTDADRTELQKELNQLTSALNDISNDTEFNTQKLLDGNFKGTFHVGANQGQSLDIEIAKMDAETLQVNGYSGEKIALDENNQIEVSSNLPTEVKITFTAAGDKNAPAVTQTSAEVGEDGTITLTLAQEAGNGVDTPGAITATQEDVLDALNKTGLVTATAIDDGDLTTAATVGAETTATAGTADPNKGINISTQENADKAITTIQAATDRVSAERSKLGAVQNRLDHTINNLGASSENLTAAESRIRDVDMAAEMMEFTKNNILTQAAQAMLAQANQTPQGVLQLLR